MLNTSITLLIYHSHFLLIYHSHFLLTYLTYPFEYSDSDDDRLQNYADSSVEDPNAGPPTLDTPSLNEGNEDEDEEEDEEEEAGEEANNTIPAPAEIQEEEEEEDLLANVQKQRENRDKD